MPSDEILTVETTDDNDTGEFTRTTGTQWPKVKKRSLDVSDQNKASETALLTLKFWETIGFDTTTLDFVVTGNSTPVIDSLGNLVIT